MSETFDNGARARFLAIADVLIPEAEGMPSASQAGIGGEVLDRALALRHDLKDDILRGLNAVASEAPDAAAHSLYERDQAAFQAIGLLAAATYFMIPRVRELVGYPGQERRTFDADATPEYVKNGALQAVIDRGAIFRATPGREATPAD